ncbi:UNVERIFIED_CONTAM: hypothetical protein GTU68_014971 [Idotea baltica]|nr:hypothetical protein [Idotea baltica]
MAERLIHCCKLGKELPGLDKPPFSDDLGEQIYQKVSKEAWLQWQDDMMIKIINEYRLNLADSEQYTVLIDQMKAFLNLEGKESALEVENPDRGK